MSNYKYQSRYSPNITFVPSLSGTWILVNFVSLFETIYGSWNIEVRRLSASSVNDSVLAGTRVPAEEFSIEDRNLRDSNGDPRKIRKSKILNFSGMSNQFQNPNIKLFSCEFVSTLGGLVYIRVL